MTVTIITGRAGAGKTAAMMGEITSSLQRDPNGDPILLLVPEQMTFQTEFRLATAPGIQGMIRAQVYSFTRLAWRVIQDTGGATRTHITSSGINMLIRKIMNDQLDRLQLFGKAAKKHGFIQHVETMLTEFRRYRVAPDELTDRMAALSEQHAPKSLVDKMKDLETIYRSFDEELAGKYIDSEDYFLLLAQQIQRSEWVKSATVYIDGFHSFTPLEYLVLGELIRHAKHVTIALTMDNHTQDAALLFRQTDETLQLVKETAHAAGADVHVQEIHGGSRFKMEGLAHLAASFEQLPAVPYAGQSGLIQAEASNRRAEVEGVAREIRRLAREEGYRYKDMAMLLRNGQSYFDFIEPVFEDYDIPFFIDQKRTMLNHPMVELIRSSLEVIVKNWRYEAVFRAAKTELLFPDATAVHRLRQQVDRLENYALALGIQGDRWYKQEHFVYRRFRGLDHVDAPQTDEEQRIEEEINEAKALIVEPIERLGKRLKKAVTAREKTKALYLFLEELRIPEKLETLAVRAEEEGQLIRAREHDQAWDAVMDLFDQLVEMLGDEEMDTASFADLLDAGLESLRFSLVPPSIDQVVIADMDLSRLSDIRAVFVMGANDGVMPMRIQDDGVLAEGDRDWLERSGMNLAPSARTRLMDEDFIAYRAFTTGADLLVVSYPIADEEGKALIPSPYVKRLQQILPDYEQKTWMNDPVELTPDEQFSYICHPTVTASYLTTQLQQVKRNYPMADHWWDVYNFYRENDLWRETSRKILSSLFYQNDTSPLTAPTTKELYGTSILASVSRMERFNSCAFSHFSSHGLKLQERSMFRLEAPDIGELFHAALKWISEELIKRKMAWPELTRDECMNLAKQAVVHLAPKLQHEILLSSNRYHYIARKLEQVIGQASFILSEHARSSGFSPIRIEVGFGPRQELPPMEFALANGGSMQLQGRIDRVDTASVDDKTYLRVIDFKSSAKDLDFTEIYYGLSMQMLTYLDIVLTNSKQLVKTEADPAGVLYFHLHNPMLKTKKKLTADEIEQELFKQYKMKGLVLGDTQAVQLMDQTLEQGQSSIISAGLKKDGTLRSDSKTASGQEFSAMRNHTRGLFQQAGDRLMGGDVAINPYEFKKRTPCQFCSYKSVCQFDPALEQNAYRKLQPKKPEDLFVSVREEEWSLDSDETN